MKKSWIHYCNQFCIKIRAIQTWFTEYIWRPPSLSELIQMISNTGLTHLGSEASIYKQKYKNLRSDFIFSNEFNKQAKKNI